MKSTTDYSIANQTYTLIKNGRYKDAFTLLRRRLMEAPVPRQLNRLMQAENTYRYMLKYFAQGASDPGRDDVLAGIRCDLLSIADSIERERCATDSSELYFSTLRMCRMHPVDIKKTLKNLVEKQALLQLADSAGVYPDSERMNMEEEEGKLFDTLWTADSLPAETYRTISDTIMRGALAPSTEAVAIAAVGLGALKQYQHDSIMLLCDLAAAADTAVAARATTHLLFALDRWSERIKDDKKLMQRLESLMDMPGMQKRMATAVMTAIRTRDTSRVTRKMERDVIPGLMQLGPDILRRLKDASQDSSLTDLEANPEWEEILEQSGLEDKLRDLSEMQSDGADVMMVAFSNMKGSAFFRQLRNWLLPFDTGHSSMRNLSDQDRNGIGDALSINFMMCDSDKFSFAFAMAMMPESQRHMVLGQMRGQMEQVSEQMKEITGVKSGENFDNLLLGYMRDLYRVVNLHPKRGEFCNPFGKPLDFTSLPVAGDSLAASAEILQGAAEFYFRRHYYDEAHPIYTRLAKISPDMPHLWEKIGYCIEKSKGQGDSANLSRQAIEAYMKARLFNPESRWISHRLGICYRKAGDLRNAVECIRQAIPAEDYDHSLTITLADILAEDGKWEEALNTLYRADYKRPGDSEVLRRMSKSALMSGKTDKAEQWMASIPAIDLKEEDHRLKGHIALIKGDIPGAMKNYRLTVRPNDEKRLWKTRILADSDMLVTLGVTKDNMLLLMEAMTYDME